MLAASPLTGFASALGATTIETSQLAVGEALVILGAVTLVGLLAAAIAWAWHERRIDESLQPS